MKKALALVLCLLLALTALPVFAQEETAASPLDYLGQPMPDFTVTTITGETFTLSEVLSAKKAVLVNLWATWCGPCEFEFPFLEEAYEAYQDEVEVIALSTEPEDTDEILAEYVASRGLTFPVANDTEAGMGPIFVDTGIPTSVLVDRFGNVVMVEVGAQSTAAAFTNAFDLLISDEYTETVVLDGFPRSKPTVQAPAEGALARAAGMPFYIASSEDEYAWPFVAAELDGKPCIASGNAHENDSVAEVTVHITAQEGDALALWYLVSSEPGYDFFTVSRNGVRVKSFSGETDWTYFVLPLEAGENDISLSYAKDPMEDGGKDGVYLADFALLSGEEAAAAIEANPLDSYPYAEETAIEILNEDAREIVFCNEDGSVYSFADAYDCVSAACYIVPGDTVRFAATLAHDMSSDDMMIIGNFQSWGAYDILDGELTDAVIDPDYGYGNLTLLNSFTYDYHTVVYLFDSEECANTFEQLLRDSDMPLTYRYADGSELSTHELAVYGPQEETALYIAVFLDQDGEPVPGCIINFCTDEACVPVVSNEEGVALFESTPYPYHLQVIKVPEGYEFDTAQEFTAEEAGGIMDFTVTKADAED